MRVRLATSMVLGSVAFMASVSLGEETEERPWIMGYLPAYNQKSEVVGYGNLHPDDIDYEALTHLMQFAAAPTADGSLDFRHSLLTPDRRRDAVSAAHAAGTPVLLCVGGATNLHARFSAAIKPEARSRLIGSIVAALTENGYDGIDIDMEPIRDPDAANYAAFVRELRAALNALRTPVLERPLLTATAIGYDRKAKQFLELCDEFDRLNIMTYDICGPWPGWGIVGHSGAMYHAGRKFPKSGRPLHCGDEFVSEYLRAGFPRGKLGIGTNLIGEVWKGGSGTETGGVTAPGQYYKGVPKSHGLAYREIMRQYYSEERYRWDEGAGHAYLSLDRPGSADDVFVSYEEERTIREKLRYIRQRGLGSLIIWDITAGYREDQPPGERDPLLRAVREAVEEFWPREARTDRAP